MCVWGGGGVGERESHSSYQNYSLLLLSKKKVAPNTFSFNLSMYETMII